MKLNKSLDIFVTEARDHFYEELGSLHNQI